jgi:hypothetical protein
MKQRWAMCAMGAWLAGTLIVSIVATENFFTVDRLLSESKNQAFHSVTERVGQAQTRELLRYLSSELNRLYFRLWNFLQLVLGLVVLWLVGRDRAAARVRLGTAAMLAIVVVMTVWLAPEITSVGRSLDFVPRAPPPPQLAWFGILHAAYTGLEMTKLVIGLAVAIAVSRSAPAHP